MRLIDLRVAWLLQYVGESTTFDPAIYPGTAGRIGQVEGYLQSTRAAVVACRRDAADWAGRVDPWAALGDLIARVEAEFPGRLLIGPDDFDRWEEDQDGLAWGLIGVEGFDALIRSEADLDRLPGLFERGVRMFQAVDSAASLLGGSSTPGDDRGLTDLGRAFLEVLLALGPDSPRAPRPIFDLAGLNPRASADALAWFEAEADRARRVLPISSHGALAHPVFDGPRALPSGHLARLRALGGQVGIGVSPLSFRAPEEVEEAIRAAAALPFEGRVGFEGIAIGTDFLGVDATLPGLGNVAEVIAWVQARFDRPTASALLRENARKLLARACGARL